MADSDELEELRGFLETVSNVNADVVLPQLDMLGIAEPQDLGMFRVGSVPRQPCCNRSRHSPSACAQPASEATPTRARQSQRVVRGWQDVAGARDWSH